MEQTNKNDLVLYADCYGNGPRMFILDHPDGLKSFRIVVHCRDKSPGPISDRP